MCFRIEIELKHRNILPTFLFLYFCLCWRRNMKQRILVIILHLFICWRKRIKIIQPKLRYLYLCYCPISKEHLFCLKRNIKWQSIEDLRLNGQMTNIFSNNIEFKNICQYNLTHLRKLQLCKCIRISMISNSQRIL